MVQNHRLNLTKTAKVLFVQLVFILILPAASFAAGKRPQVVHQDQREPSQKARALLLAEKISQHGNGTKIESIEKWVDLSPQYVLGYGRDESTGKLTPFAIYDKTLAWPNNAHFWDLVLLGTVGFNEVNLARLSQFIDEYGAKADPEGRSIPVKVVDLKWKNSSLKNAALWVAITNLIKGGITAIPIFGPPQIVNALLERSLDYLEILFLHHHAQALLLFLDAVDGNVQSPFLTEALTHDQLIDAIHYLLRTNTMLSKVFVHAFKKNKNLAEDYIERMNRLRIRSIKQLEKNGVEIYPLPQTYYALGVKRNLVTRRIETVKIYCLVHSKLFRKNKPHASVDFLNPHSERVLRNALVAVQTCANFIYIPVPVVQTVLRLAYKETVIREIHRRQMWENGLLAHLKHHPGELRNLLIEKLHLSPDQASQFESRAIKTVEARRMNPLELTGRHLDYRRLRMENWIRDQDDSYHPGNGLTVLPLCSVQDPVPESGELMPQLPPLPSEMENAEPDVELPRSNELLGAATQSELGQGDVMEMISVTRVVPSLGQLK
jgi:hypothetical protein